MRILLAARIDKILTLVVLMIKSAFSEISNVFITINSQLSKLKSKETTKNFSRNS